MFKYNSKGGIRTRLCYRFRFCHKVYNGALRLNFGSVMTTKDNKIRYSANFTALRSLLGYLNLQGTLYAFVSVGIIISTSLPVLSAYLTV